VCKLSNWSKSEFFFEPAILRALEPTRLIKWTQMNTMFKHVVVSLIISTTATMMRMIYYLHGNIQTHRSVTAAAAEMSGAICDSCAIVQIVYDVQSVLFHRRLHPLQYRRHLNEIKKIRCYNVDHLQSCFNCNQPFNHYVSKTAMANGCDFWFVLISNQK